MFILSKVFIVLREAKDKCYNTFTVHYEFILLLKVISTFFFHYLIDDNFCRKNLLKLKFIQRI